MFNKKLFSDRINLLINANKVTHQALADSVGIKRQAVGQFTNGNNLPSIETLTALACFFNVSVDYLLGLSDKPERR